MCRLGISLFTLQVLILLASDSCVIFVLLLLMRWYKCISLLVNTPLLGKGKPQWSLLESNASFRRESLVLAAVVRYTKPSAWSALTQGESLGQIDVTSAVLQRR